MAVDTLGCGKYEAYFKLRGGHTYLGRARDMTALSWQRRLNDVSEAHITIALNGTSSEECCGLAATVNPWEHELSIYRDGTEVWCGPVTGGEIDDELSSVTYDAKDLTAWFDHRWVEVVDTDVDFEEADITVVFDWLLSHGYYKDPFNLEWFVGEPLNIPLTRTYYSFAPPGERWGGIYPMIGSEIRDLLKSRIDYTTIRRVMIAGNLQDSTGQQKIHLVDGDFQKRPKIGIVGTGMATEQAVAGSNGGTQGYYDDQLWIERPYDSDRAQFGLLQSIDTAPELDEEDTYQIPNMITQRAVELRALRSTPYNYLRDGQLSQHAAVTFDQLIPGRFFYVDLAQGCRPVKKNYLLMNVNVKLGKEGEEVSIDLVPPGLEQATRSSV